MGITPICFLKARDLADSGDSFCILSYSYQKDKYGKLEVVVTILTTSDHTEKRLHIPSSRKRDDIIEAADNQKIFKLVSRPFSVNGEQRTYFDLITLEDSNVPF